MGDHEAAVQVPCCIFTLQLGRPTGFSEGVCCYVAWMSRTYPSGSTRGLRVGERCTVFLESFSNMFPKQTCHFVTRLSSFEGHCYLPTTWGRQKSSIGFLWAHCSDGGCLSFFSYKTYTVLPCFAPLQNWWLRLTHTQQGTKQAKKQTNPRLSGICLDYGNLSEGHLAADKAVSLSSHLFAWIEPSFSFDKYNIDLSVLTVIRQRPIRKLVCPLLQAQGLWQQEGDKKEEVKVPYSSALLNHWEPFLKSSRHMIWLGKLVVCFSLCSYQRRWWSKRFPMQMYSKCLSRQAMLHWTQLCLGKLSAGSFHGFVFHLLRNCQGDWQR